LERGKVSGTIQAICPSDPWHFFVEKIIMRAVTATATIGSDHTLTMQVPADIQPGVRTVVVVLEEARDAREPKVPLKFSPHPVGPVDPACTYRREDIYGDDGR
jgi:hypothetical protein